MRLSHYALALTIILLAITGFLAWEAQEEAKGARKELELVRRQQAAYEMAMPTKPATVTNLPPPPEAPAAPTLPALAGSDLMPGTPTRYASPAAAAAPLTDLQKQLLGLPSYAKVVEVHNDQGFAVISAGRDKQLTSGMKFDVRRGNGLVGRVIVGETIDAAEAVVDIDNTAALPGVHIEAGDELIQPIRR
ncbi:hypothetical protein [Prosthecobacter sp.]|uniref:hypothetical protein n=1 Tax=Prosthecobacter sp. TaxID=1965333 RepID=UPI002489CDEC|nr:hypothetical protein [Prosthecobacter sp.]MDI1311135.1 hypothetical protein [Prosthecobacter sp.]